jgi:Predicted ATPase
MKVRDGLSTHLTVAQQYDHLVEKGAIKRDPAQERVVRELDLLVDRIREKRMARKSRALGWLFGKGKKTNEPITGLYIHGEVGRGKSMLMDLFYQIVPARAKRRVHFNVFMADVHDRIARHRQALKDGKTKETDPIPPVAAELAQETWVLCFDEFTVTDIADAMILSRLFSSLFENGVVLIATSNVDPDDLYKDGLNRGLFLPFIKILKDHVKVLHLAADTDYRMEKLNRLPVYLTPLGPETERMMDQAWETVVNGREVRTETVTVMGRGIPVPRAAGDAARFSFAELCEAPLGARDYQALVERYKTLFIDDIPVMDLPQRNAAKRFILLVDTLYEARTRVVLSAAAAPDRLYIAKTGTESFEFARTASRLTEMQSEEWQETSAAAAAAG